MTWLQKATISVKNSVQFAAAESLLPLSMHEPYGRPFSRSWSVIAPGMSGAFLAQAESPKSLPVVASPYL
jgi:hypothetical protein